MQWGKPKPRNPETQNPESCPNRVHQWGLIHEPFGYKSSDLTVCPEGQKARCRFLMASRHVTL